MEVALYVADVVENVAGVVGAFVAQKMNVSGSTQEREKS